MVDTHNVAAETKYTEEFVGRVRTDKNPPDDERVTVKPDSQGGYTVEKFGGSTHFTRPQWDNLTNAVKVADEEQKKRDEAARKVDPDTLDGQTVPTGKSSVGKNNK